MRFNNFLTALLVLVSSAIVAQKTNADWKKLHYLSEKEMHLPLNAASFYETAPPVGPIRNVAEFDQMEAVVVRYPFGIPLTLVKEIAKDLEVLTLVANENEQQTVITRYTIQPTWDVPRMMNHPLWRWP